MTTRSLLARWTSARVRLMLRNPRVTFFTFAFPLMFLVIFSAINKDVTVTVGGVDVPYAQFYAPSIGIFGLSLACYTNVIFGLANARDVWLLKRIRGTPLPMPVYLASWLGGAVLLGLASVVLMFVVAVPVFGVDIYPSMLPAAIVTLVIGAAALAALGLAVATMTKTADQAAPLAQLTLLPLTFISGIFWPLDGAPDWLVGIAKAFPLYHLVQAFDACFVPGTTGGGWAFGHLAVIAAWGVAGLLVAVRRFQAEPNVGERRSWRTRTA